MRRQPKILRQRMRRRNTVSAGNAASGANVASENVASECGVSRECSVRGERGVRECGVTGFWNAASECELSVRWKSAGPFSAAPPFALRVFVHWMVVISSCLSCFCSCLVLVIGSCPVWVVSWLLGSSLNLLGCLFGNSLVRACLQTLLP